VLFALRFGVDAIWQTTCLHGRRTRSEINGGDCLQAREQPRKASRIPSIDAIEEFASARFARAPRTLLCN
jgi:hypothetical protein